MKKILGLILVTLLLVSCGTEDGTKKNIKGSEGAQGEIIERMGSINLWMTIYEVDGIEYRIFSMYNGGMHTVNHTKELLEVELLKKQLNK